MGEGFVGEEPWEIRKDVVGKRGYRKRGLIGKMEKWPEKWPEKWL